MADTTDKSYSEEQIEEIRLAVLAIRDSEGVAAAEIARQSGIPAGTLTPWLVRKYAGDNARIAAAMRRWLDSRASQRRARAVLPQVPGFIRTPTAGAFLDALEYAQSSANMITISGGAGVGKTWAARAYQQQAPNVWLLTIRPSISNLRPMLAALLGVLGLGEAAASRRTTLVTDKLAGSGGLLIVDEAQHLQVTALEELRSIYDVAGIGLALVGNETVYARLEGQGRTAQFAQLYSRLSMRTRRTNAQRGDILAVLDAWGIAGAAERRLLLAIGNRPGALRGITQTLRQAHMLALGEAAEDAAPTITADHIARAWSRVSDQPADAIASREGN